MDNHWNDKLFLILNIKFLFYIHVIFHWIIIGMTID
jgi:hypothetical protein